MFINGTKIEDPDSGERLETFVCEYCNGAGGFDASRDCEVYDEWIDCEWCNGTGEYQND